MKRSQLSALPDVAVIAPSIPERILRLARQLPEGSSTAEPRMPDLLHVYVRQWVEDLLAETLADDAADPGLYATVLRLYEGLFAQGLQASGSVEGAAEHANSGLQLVLTRVCDHTPEDAVTLKDVACSFLKVDKEYFSGALRNALVNELLSRRLLNPADLRAFNQRELSLPALALRMPDVGDPSASDVQRLIRDHGEALGVHGVLGLRLMTFQVDSAGQASARVAVMHRGVETANHGLLMFRANGTLMDWQSPFPAGLRADEAASLFDRAQEAGLTMKAAVSVVARAEGGFTARAVQRVGHGRTAQFIAFTLEHPEGTRLGSRRPPPSAISLLPDGELLTG